jgi:hypothetical protein
MLRRFQKGQSILEYAIILAVVIGGILVVSGAMRSGVQSIVNFPGAKK